jgi:hypothetical protein
MHKIPATAWLFVVYWKKCFSSQIIIRSIEDNFNF